MSFSQKWIFRTEFHHDIFDFFDRVVITIGRTLNRWCGVGGYFFQCSWGSWDDFFQWFFGSVWFTITCIKGRNRIRNVVGISVNGRCGIWSRCRCGIGVRCGRIGLDRNWTTCAIYLCVRLRCGNWTTWGRCLRCGNIRIIGWTYLF